MTTTYRKRFYHYCFTTAMEGGIGYWAVASEYHWSQAGANSVTGVIVPPDDIDGFYATVVPPEGEEWGVTEVFRPDISGMDDTPMAERTVWLPDEMQREPLTINKDVIERGVNLLVDNVIAAVKSEDEDAPFSRRYLRQFVIQWLTDLDDGDSDSDVCDLVVQLGLFGEVVYS